MSRTVIRLNKNRPIYVFIAALLISITASQPAMAKKAPVVEYLPAEHAINGEQAQIFQATIAALEDAGFIINSVDSSSGFIRASTPIRDTRDAFERLIGQAEYQSNYATVTMIPNGTGGYTVRLRLIRSRTESQSGFGDFDQSGEQNFERVDRSTENYNRIFSLIDARMASMQSPGSSDEIASTQ